MTNTNNKTQETQPNGSQVHSPDFGAVFTMIFPDDNTPLEIYQNTHRDIPHIGALDNVANETIKRLYNSPEALKALGICKLDPLELSEHGFFECDNTEEALSKTVKLEEELVEAKQRLKAVRDMHTVTVSELLRAVDVIQSFLDIDSSIMDEESYRTIRPVALRAHKFIREWAKIKDVDRFVRESEAQQAKEKEQV